jgi:hypothetical protein
VAGSPLFPTTCFQGPVSAARIAISPIIFDDFKMKQFPKDIDVSELDQTFIMKTDLTYSICTIVNSFVKYNQMLESFLNSGFNKENSEYIYVDNEAANKYDAYDSIRRFLKRACGKYIIICHQDIVLVDDERVLSARLEELDNADSRWAMATNAGVDDKGRQFFRYVHPSGLEIKRGDFPHRIAAADEHFLLLKASSGINPSPGLSGFHLYGTDIAVHARLAGQTAYAIDFNLVHFGLGTVDDRYFDELRRFQASHLRDPKPAFFKNTVAPVYIGRPKPIWRAKQYVWYLRSRGYSTKNFMRLAIKAKHGLLSLFTRDRYSMGECRIEVPKLLSAEDRENISRNKYLAKERSLFRKYMSPDLNLLLLGSGFGIMQLEALNFIRNGCKTISVDADEANIEFTRKNLRKHEQAGRMDIMNAALVGPDKKSNNNNGLPDSSLKVDAEDNSRNEGVGVRLSDLVAKFDAKQDYQIYCDLNGKEFMIFGDNCPDLERCKRMIVVANWRNYDHVSKSIERLRSLFVERGFLIKETQYSKTRTIFALARS